MGTHGVEAVVILGARIAIELLEECEAVGWPARHRDGRARQADRFAREMYALERLARARGVAFVEDQMEHVEDGAEDLPSSIAVDPASPFSSPAYARGMNTTKSTTMDKVVVITGASAGIGAELARQLGARAAKVVLAARRKPELDTLAAEIGKDALAVVADVTKRSDVEHLCSAALERFGRIDVWVNNAGRGISRAVAELTDDDLDAMWRDNMKSVVYGMQAVLPHFKSRNEGQIVNVSSGLSRAPLAPARAAYGAVKSAVNMLSASLRVELRATHPGIHVTVLLPGVVATDFGRNALGGGVDNHNLPGAQPVEAAAKAIVEVIEHPKPDAYTSPFIAEIIARYQREPEAMEAEIASRQR